ncbi:MAG: DUF488 domain-containing protein [Candidatus Binatia bacterium]|nr:DUF488 domain-containing protein [Candidatus Binatia bacterium]
MAGTLRVKRVYDPVEQSDGFRVLVDRLWPRGLKKETARIDLWLKDIGPSDALRKWFGHNPERFATFNERYRKELKVNPATLGQLLEVVRQHSVVTLVYGARDRECNHAVVLREFVEALLRAQMPTTRRKHLHP